MQRSPLKDAAAHESRHAGYLWVHGVDIRTITVRPDGSGAVAPRLHRAVDLRAIHSVSPAVFAILLETRIAGALAGVADCEALEAGDQAFIARQLELHAEITGRDAGPILERAELRATTWCTANAGSITRFAERLAYRQWLSGAEIEAAMAGHFRRVRQPIPTGAALQPWLASHRKAKQKAALERSARAMEVYCDLMSTRIR